MKCNENFLYDSNQKIILKTYHSLVEPGKRRLWEHHHTECELSLVVSGSGIYSVCGKEYTFSDGDMFLFGSNEAHCITDITTPLDLLNIQFEPRILWENADSIELLSIFNQRNETFENHFKKEDSVLQKIILKIEQELEQKNKSYQIMVKVLIFTALVHLIRSYDYVRESNLSQLGYSQFEKLKEAMIYIDKNIEKKLTLKEIAASVCMAETYFSAVFKKFNGISPWKYITIKRVERAIDLIKNTDMTKLEIAEKCGFSGSSNFYKAFANVTGKTPSQYENTPAL